ncbi:Mad3/BUB1 homology region 1-domain-containing protein [Fomitopsis serialis]|uniref:Mad3/BUB1 homology region 1-domain-containing protein n=1 Tax=Fomitopsis serialis TaxID=139415 RepID=UPI002008DDCF|nr:Mad3/BUB1 homology region 1-domain-containing protein [Neoantrodia serialis]KAH9917831.1 Mad3/BUB1 homology region 1-domain-containing protein [Neoantrodia serialis]
MDGSNDLLKKRERFREQIRTALEEDPDPLSAYDNFVKWTLENYPKQHLAQSGLLELLAEATRQFKDDAAYKGDLRYLKLWSLYANHVEDPSVVYAYLLANGIGMVYAQTYWEYALALECAGRRAEAEAVYKQGVQRRARPVDPLKRRYEEFKNRTSPPTSIASTNAVLWKGASSSTRALRRNPLKYHTSDSPSASSSADSQPTSSAPSTSQTSSADQKRERYALMLAPPVPGKRPEKLRFNLSLLFTEDGTEYSMQEARARSMGLLGKKWGPPPEAAAVRVNFKDGPSTNSSRTGMTRTMRKGFEPTVTLATKEALADVFGMYNSPEKSMRFGAVAGSKHAPVHKVASVAPMSLEAQFRAASNENALVATKTPKNNENAMIPVKTPRANENAGVPAKTPVHTIHGRGPPSKLPTYTPNHGRKALSVKDVSTPAQPAKDELSQSTKTPGAFKSGPVFSAVFTPAAEVPKDRPVARRDTGPDQQPPSRATSASPPRKVFSRPPTRNENIPAPEPTSALQSSTIIPYVDGADEIAAPTPARQPLSELVEPEELVEEDTQQTIDDSYEEDDEELDGVQDELDQPSPVDEYDSMLDDGEELASRPTPLGGRFGKFDRTIEYAASMRSTPNDTINARPTHQDPVEAAELLAAELLEEEEAEGRQREAANALSDIEERTGTLSLSDALTAASSFQPPNPCNPQQDSDRLEAIQNGNTTGRMTEDLTTLEINLLDRRFGIVDKLGEGGFGAVFEAVDLDKQEELDEADEVDLDAEEQSRVALKVVKPRNLWEFHVLRRIHRTLPSALRNSIITPQALYAFRDESYLVLELRKQGTLLDVVNRAAQNGMTQQGGCLDELLVIFFAIELMRLLEGLHRADGPRGPSGLASIYQPSGEGDWCYKGIKMIDFGRTIDTRLFPAGQQYLAEWPTDARDCLEIREGRPWTFQTDYFGLAGIIYCMLYGKYIEASSVSLVPGTEDRYKLATPMKRYWQGDLWTRLFDLLLNPCLARDDGQLPVCDELAGLRVEMENWLQVNCNRATNTLKGLLKKLSVVALRG